VSLNNFHYLSFDHRTITTRPAPPHGRDFVLPNEMFRSLLLLTLPLILAACQKSPPVEAAMSRPPPDELALVQTSCGECHAVRKNEISHRSNAPAFPDIVNTQGVTRETLTTWLRGAHNYPSEMDFYLDDRKVDAIVNYLFTLREPKFKRTPG